MSTIPPNGVHCLLELHGCDEAILRDECFINDALRRAVEAGFATMIKRVSHKFTPHGVTALALIAESHVSIHTWPECGYVAADAFTCGDHANAVAACENLIASFQPTHHDLQTIERGVQSSTPTTMQ